MAVKPVPVYMKAAMVMGTLLCIVTGLFPSYCYELMPNATMAHPFSAEHIVEYVALSSAQRFHFARYIKKMEPNDVITLDFDWIYRITLVEFLSGLSKWVYRIFSRFEHTYYNFERIIKTILRNPSKVFSGLELDEANAEEYFEEQRPGGRVHADLYRFLCHRLLGIADYRMTNVIDILFIAPGGYLFHAAWGVLCSNLSCR